MTETATPVTTTTSTTTAGASLLAALKAGALATLPVLGPAIGAAVKPMLIEFGDGIAKVFKVTDPAVIAKIDTALEAVGEAAGAIVTAKISVATA